MCVLCWVLVAVRGVLAQARSGAHAQARRCGDVAPAAFWLLRLRCGGGSVQAAARAADLWRAIDRGDVAASQRARHALRRSASRECRLGSSSWGCLERSIRSVRFGSRRPGEARAPAGRRFAQEA